MKDTCAIFFNRVQVPKQVIIGRNEVVLGEIQDLRILIVDQSIRGRNEHYDKSNVKKK